MSLLTRASSPTLPPSPPSAESLIEACLASLAPDLSGRWQQSIALPGTNPGTARFVMIDASSPLADSTAASAHGEILWLSTQPAHDPLNSLDSQPDGAQWTCGPGALIHHRDRSAWFALPTSLSCSLPHTHRIPWLACTLAAHLLHLPPTTFQNWLIQHS